MAKVKVKRHGVSLDMTAMCDVAFLLLTFFMLTTKFRPDEAVQVTPPTSISDLKLPSKDMIMITIDKDGKVFFGVDSQVTRGMLLDKMAAKYQVAFTPAEKQTFMLMENFGTPIAALKQILNMKSEERNKPGLQPGIPSDSLKNELFHWVLYARQVAAERGIKGLRIGIKGDGASDYTKAEFVIGTLQEQKINKFNLITGLENKPTI